MCLWLALAAVGATGGGEPVPLAALQQMLGWSSCVERAETIDIGDGTNRLRFFPGMRRAELNGVAVWLNAVAEPAGTSLVNLAAADVERVLLPLFSQPSREPAPLRVMLDPGHGGEDGGASSSAPHLLEKELVLDLALRIGARLETAGMAVGYTRTNDTFLTLSERTALAGAWRADVFVSLHANTAGNRLASGRETYVLPLAGHPPTGAGTLSDRPRAGNGHDRHNTLLGYHIHRQIPGRSHSADRGLRRARFQVLRQAPCPAALIEVGFLSNGREAERLASGWYRERLADAVASGVLEYARHLAADAPGKATSPAPCPPADDVGGTEDGTEDGDEEVKETASDAP